MGVELFGGPLEVTLDPRAKIQMEEVAASLSKIEREMLKVAMADQRVAQSTEELGKRFRAGFISAEQLRGALRSMAGDLPRTAEEFRKADRAAEQYRERLSKVATAAHALTAVRHGFDLMREGARGAMEAIEHVSERLAEFQRLQRVQRELGVNFAQSQAGSERFVSQENVAGLAEHFASAHVNLNQQQLNSMTQGAARLAQMQGTSVEMQSDRLFSAIVGGELEVLRRLGPEMAALSGQSHTAQERLEAFMRTVQQLGPATEDTATALERFKESLKMGERTFLASVKDELEGLSGPDGPMTRMVQQFASLTGNAEAWGRRTAQAIALVGTGVNALMTTWGGLHRAIGVAAMTQAGALGAASRGDLSGAGRTIAQGTAELNRIRSEVGDSWVAFTSTVSAARERGTTGTPGSDGLAGAGGGTAPTDQIADNSAVGIGWGRAVGEGAIGGASMPTGRGGAFGRRRRGGGGRRSRGEGRFAYSVQAAANADREEMDVMLASKENDRQELLATLAEQQRTAQGEMAAGIANKQNEAAQLAEQERQRSLMGSLTEAAHRYDETMFHLKGTVVGAFEDMSAALGGHVAAWAEGKETFGDAMQGMLGDFLKATSKRALMSGTEEAVASLASLAIGDLRGAGLHAAASAGYFTLAGLAGAAGAAVAPSAAGGAAGGAASRDRAPSIAPRSSSTGSAGQNITINFGAPVVAGNPAQAGRLIASMVRDAVAREGVTIPGLGLS